MILTFPNYLDQTQILGLPGVIEWHGAHEEIVTPYPLCIAIGTETEYGITIETSTEYGITIDTEACE